MNLLFYFFFKKLRGSFITNLQCACRSVCVSPVTTADSCIRRGARRDGWTGFIFSVRDYLEEMRSPFAR